jgi:hypothetical protein
MKYIPYKKLIEVIEKIVNSASSVVGGKIWIRTKTRGRQITSILLTPGDILYYMIIKT